MFPVASSTALITQAMSDTGTIMVLVLASVVTAVIALLGLGFAIRHTKKHVTGKKF